MRVTVTVEVERPPGVALSADSHREEVAVTIPDGLFDTFAWWIATAAEDAKATFPKSAEYGGTVRTGSVDLMLIGEILALLLDMRDATSAVKQELGVWFYLQGKIGRLVSDYQQHRPGKADTWFDSTVYTMMARRLQETGEWP